MANIFSIIPYQIDSHPPLTAAQATAVYLPTTGVMLTDVTNSPTRSLSSGVNVYSLVTVIATGQKYYVSTTVSALATTINT